MFPVNANMVHKKTRIANYILEREREREGERERERERDASETVRPPYV